MQFFPSFRGARSANPESRTASNESLPLDSGSSAARWSGMTAGNVPSPGAERRRPEQCLLRRGLRAPVLRRRLDLAAEFGRGVPAPARVVEHGARQRDHFALPGRYDPFGLLPFPPTTPPQSFSAAAL